MHLLNLEKNINKNLENHLEQRDLHIISNGLNYSTKLFKVMKYNINIDEYIIL